jgi:hypothetical protein
LVGWSAWLGAILICSSSNLGSKSFSGRELAAVCDRTLETTLAVQIVPNKVTGLELTVYETAAGKRTSSERAVSELTFNKINDIEDTPVPINILKRAGGEIRLDVFPFRGDPQELGVLEAIFAPIHRLKIVGRNNETLHLSA